MHSWPSNAEKHYRNNNCWSGSNLSSSDKNLRLKNHGWDYRSKPEHHNLSISWSNKKQMTQCLDKQSSPKSLKAFIPSPIYPSMT